MLVYDIFNDWLDRDDDDILDPAVPRTWKDLAITLKKTDEKLEELAHELQKHFQIKE